MQVTNDPGGGVIVAPSRGVGQAVRANDAWIAFINHDGSVHTPRWVGIQNAGAERDGGTPDATNPSQSTPSVAVVRTFDLATGRPIKSITVPGSTWLNDITVAADGTVYGTNTGAPDRPETWVIEANAMIRRLAIALCRRCQLPDLAAATVTGG